MSDLSLAARLFEGVPCVRSRHRRHGPWDGAPREPPPRARPASAAGSSGQEPGQQPSAALAIREELARRRASGDRDEPAHGYDPEALRELARQEGVTTATGPTTHRWDEGKTRKRRKKRERRKTRSMARLMMGSSPTCDQARQTHHHA